LVAGKAPISRIVWLRRKADVRSSDVECRKREGKAGRQDKGHMVSQ
jgi:hypothetical protein